MGPDTPELIHEWETYFNIHIPASESAKIDTVLDAIDCIARQLKIDTEDSGLRQTMSNRVNTALIETGRIRHELKPRQAVFDIISPADSDCFNQLSNKMGLLVPQPTRNSEEGLFDTFIPKKVNYDYRLITAGRFTDVICAENFRKVLDIHAIGSRYEITIAVIGITAHKLGIDPYEITPQKSIARNLNFKP